ncbi:MAG TPA: VanW family protein [Chloroflexota bacterium]|nr:VanW family protein [Chloroflexota bacterium]
MFQAQLLRIISLILSAILGPVRRRMGAPTASKRWLAALSMTTVLMLPAGAQAAAPAPTQAPSADGAPQKDGAAFVRYFPETGHTLAGNFRDYFEAHGGLDAFGFPRTDAVMENGLQVQYFQRARMEWHPDTSQVQLSLLGSILTAGRSFATVPPVPNGPDLQYFPQTNHTVHHAFLAYFNSHGGVDQFGYPIAEESTEDGFRVQWFQRARMEYHPELPAAYTVSLSLLGDQYIDKNLKGSGWIAPAPQPQLIAEGTSNFSYSPDVRVTNIQLMAKKLNGVQVPDGATFSFNDIMGDVTAAAGWAVGLVILDGVTQDGLGGGICQVSTTTFRAAFWAGLPIVERHDHSYPVPYYTQGGAPEGFDATVWSPTLDFKFLNDTGAPLTITTYVDLRTYNLYVDFYGKPTNRNVSMIGPVISNVKPAPPDRYITDPKLKPGAVDQTDFSHQGFDVMLKRSMTLADGTVKVDSFPSHYVPWQAVYHVGPTPADSTSG